MHIVGAALTEREHVMYLLGGRQLASLLTLLAERVRGNVAVAYSFPSSAVPLVGLRLTLKMIVMIVRLSLMLLAVKTVRQLRTAGVLTRALWFLWHDVTSVRVKRKPCGITPTRLSRFCFPKGANIFAASPVIAVTTFVCSLVALLLGQRFGRLLGSRAEVFGGVILLLIAAKAVL